MALVSALYVYPIKACRGISLPAWAIVERGFEADRRWMIVDPAGRFVTQRQVARLALVGTALHGESITVSASGFEPLQLPRRYDITPTRTVTIWRDQSLACVHPLGSDWFSAFLGAPHELVYMPDAQRRQVDPARANAGDVVGFADGFPFLLISEASLSDLNRRLEQPLPMERFRPNIVVTGTEPFAEDQFARVQLGDVSFRGVKRCHRCSVTTVDPETGQTGREPLHTLAKYRLQDSKVWFGMNMIHDGLGMLRVGDPVRL